MERRVVSRYLLVGTCSENIPSKGLPLRITPGVPNLGSGSFSWGFRTPSRVLSCPDVCQQSVERNSLAKLFGFEVHNKQLS